MPEKASVGEIDIHRVLAVLRRRRLVILALTVLVPLAALAYSLSQSKQYTATTTALYQDPQLTQQITGSLSLLPSEDPARVAATNLKLAQLATVASMTSKQLHRPIGSVSVSSDASTDLVTFSATSTSPRFAATVANTYANQYVSFRRQQNAATIMKVQGLVQREYSTLPQAAKSLRKAKTLANTANRLGVLASLQTGDAALVQPAGVPSSPSSPKTVRNVIIGLAVGLMAGLALAFLLDLVDRRVRDPSELEEILKRPVLAGVPELKELREAKANGSAKPRPLPGRALEPFQMLRTNLRYFNVDRELKVILITSAGPGEGKTTVAWNLAAAAARSGTRALLIEADLRRPALAARHGISMANGLSTLLSSHDPLSDAVAHVVVRRVVDGQVERVTTIDVVPGGPMPPNPSDMLESRRMAQLVEEAGASYDLVVVDTPPVSVVSDAVPLMRLVDGVLVVSRLRKVTRDSALHLHRQLERLDAPVIGVVVNAIAKRAGYGYGYGYGYYSKDGLEYLSTTDELGAVEEHVVENSNGRRELVGDAVAHKGEEDR
jgi:capsular exopolysaccharide synthesis family protein